MTRYRLRSIVSEWDGDDLWVGALPDGPISWIGGTGALVLETLGVRENAARTIAAIAEELRERVPDMPQEPETMLNEFLESLEAIGIVEAVTDGGGS